MSITIKDLRFAYGRTMVLHDIAATAGAGRITAVLGPNASGKSTLLRCIVGGLKPSAGSVWIDNVETTKLRAAKRARRIAYVSQRPDVSAAFSVRQVVELGRHALSRNASRVDAALERLDLADVADRPYQQLSAGQQQRVSLARAHAQLATDGHLVMDEPTSAMDLRHVAQTVVVIRELAAAGATVVIAMHDLSLAAAVADDVWLLDSGRLVAGGPAAEVLNVNRLEEVFGVPFHWLAVEGESTRLLARMPGAR